ncbi:LysR substrate-binding domain-containing protein [Streptomyces nigrescens]
MDQLPGAPSGRLVVGSTATYSSYLLLPMFGRFAELFPGVERQLRTGNTTEITRQLTDGEVRLAVLPGDRAGASPHYRVEPLLEEQLLLVAHPGHPLAGHAVSPADLAQQRFLFREEGSATRRAQDDALALWGLPPSRCPGVTGNETLKQAAAAGLGIAVMPQRCVTQELRDGHLALLRPDPGLPACTIVLATARETSLSPAEQEFASLLRTKGDA